MIAFMVKTLVDRLASRPKNAATIMDISRLAGVSVNTVSLSLRNDPRVRLPTKHRVREAAEQLDYRPNAAARALAGNKVPYIGLINACSAPGPLAMSVQGLIRCQAPLIAELDKRLADCGLHLVLAGEDPYISGSEAGSAFEPPALLRQHHVSGVLVLNHIWPGLYQAVTRWNVPCVAIAEPSPGIPVVSIDRRHGAEEAVKHLIELGHRRIACLPGSKGSAEVATKSAMKAMGYLSAMSKAGLSSIPGWDEPVEGGHPNAVTTLLPALLDREPNLTALLVYDDGVAIHAIDYLRDRGIRVPRDLSVFSLEDNNLGDVCRPTISCVGSPCQAMARIAVETLMQLIKDESPSRSLSPVCPQIIVRGSTAAPPVT